MSKKGLMLGITVSLIFISAGLAFAQEAAAPVAAAEEVKDAPEVQWLWGEVVSVDTAGKTVLVKYLDYETDQEKEMAISVDEKTTYENAQSLNAISPKDTLSIDYIVSPEGKSIAKNISVEKLESAPIAKPEAAETVPEDLEPAPVVPGEE